MSGEDSMTATGNGGSNDYWRGGSEDGGAQVTMEAFTWMARL